MHFKLLPCFISLKGFVVKLILYLSYLLMDTPLSSLYFTGTVLGTIPSITTKLCLGNLYQEF